MGDLGISAEDVLKAFGSLTEKELAQPPEQSVDKLVMALGLTGQQALLAKQNFQELMAKTQAGTAAEQFNSAPKQNSLAILSEREFEKRNLQQSLDKMDRNFFTRPRTNDKLARQDQTGGEQGALVAPVAAEGENPEPSASTVDRASAFRMAAMSIPGLAPLATPSAAPVASETAALAPAAEAATNPGNEINGLLAQMQATAPGDKKALDEIVKNFTLHQSAKGMVVPMTAGPVPAAGVERAVAAPSAAASPTMASPAGLSGLFAGRQNSPQDSTDDAGDESGTGAFMGAAPAGDTRVNGLNAPKGEFQAQMAQAAHAAPPMAIPDLMQQAHIMVRDGGGDLKVTLHPDGLGEVAMRVSVTDGRVNVQMITESDEAKKLIERQIGELKTGLTANHLQVESIKVDTATNLGQQLEQQYRDASRQQAQANMEQFRQDHQGWRRSFFETGSINPYMNQTDAPRDARAPLAARKVNNRRLDLVA
jgi:flagellar hook-length control protein FliK